MMYLRWSGCGFVAGEVVTFAVTALFLGVVRQGGEEEEKG